MRDKYVFGCVALTAVTLLGVTVACNGIDGVVSGAIIGTYILIVREIIGEKVRKTKETTTQETGIDGEG